MALDFVFQDQQMQLGSPYQLQASDEHVELSVLRFFISDIVLLYQGREVGKGLKAHHLVDLAVPESHVLNWKLKKGRRFDAIRFNVGVDSLTNVSGAQGGDLDPVTGMYWTWQSGYINFKLEGTAPQCPARKHKFQFHLGGFQEPFNSLQTISLPVDPATGASTIQIDLWKLFEQVDLKENYQVMNPNAAAVKLSALLPSLFTLTQ